AHRTRRRAARQSSRTAQRRGVDGQVRRLLRPRRRAAPGERCRRSCAAHPRHRRLRRQRRLLRDGRRELNRYVRACLGIVLGIAMLGAAGCAGDRAAPDASVLRVAMSTFSDGTFLPWNGSTGRKLYLDTIYEYLVYLDPETLEPQPGLAEDWSVSPTGDTVTLSLRRGVEFHDGWGELTADDVAYTFERMMARSSIAGMASTLRYLIDRVEVV